MRNLRRVDPTEHQIQSAIVAWANKTSFKNGIIGDYLIAIPNGGYRNKLEAKRLKDEGVKAGVSDMFLAIPIKTEEGIIVCGLWMEVKTTKGKLTEPQKIWGTRMFSNNYIAVVIRGVDEGIEIIKNYLGITN